MQRSSFVVTGFAIICSTTVGFGLAREQIGPDKNQAHPTTEQPGCPAGLVDILRHDARVYSVWVNGNTNYYFTALPDEMGELIRLFSETRLRDHVVTLKKGTPEVKPFNVPKGIPYNVHLHHLEGIALAMTRREGEAKTHEPTLTIHVDEGEDLPLLKQLAIPDNIILRSEFPNWPDQGQVPEREVWHAQVRFEGGEPAVDFESGVSTAVTLWEKDEEEPIHLGNVDHKGFFRVALSDAELADLKAERSWLTLTVGNYLTEPTREDPRLLPANLSPQQGGAEPAIIGRPSYYYGRILFDDGSPAILDPEPWPGGHISVSFPFAGSVDLDPEGYFRLYFTPAQFGAAKAKKVRKNVYIPSFDEKGRSSARYAFPPSDLSQEKEKAGELRIARPGPEKE